MNPTAAAAAENEEFQKERLLTVIREHCGDDSDAVRLSAQRLAHSLSTQRLVHDIMQVRQRRFRTQYFFSSVNSFDASRPLEPKQHVRLCQRFRNSLRSPWNLQF